MLAETFVQTPRFSAGGGRQLTAVRRRTVGLSWLAAFYLFTWQVVFTVDPTSFLLEGGIIKVHTYVRVETREGSGSASTTYVESEIRQLGLK